MRFLSGHIKQDNVGDMRHRVKIMTYSTARNAAGEEILTWSQLAEVWAHVEYKQQGSDEPEKANRVTAQINAVVRIRYRADVNEKMRLLFDGKIWNIRALLPDMHKAYTVIEAEYFYT